MPVGKEGSAVDKVIKVIVNPFWLWRKGLS
jgi:hypothetical protein